MSKLDCLLISTGRAASTAIYRYLDAAAELNLPENKEPHFWCDVRQRDGLYGDLLNIYTQDSETYWGLYEESGRSIDASCGYFFYIDEVIEKLQACEQRPRVIFLYREPVERAISFFNERRRKELTDVTSFEEDLARVRPQGLWWEYYYDNVDYDRCFGRIRDYFDQIIAVNYDYFARNQQATLKALLDFLELPGDRLETLRLEPVNSSEQATIAVFARNHPRLHAIASQLPAPIKRWMESAAVQFRRARSGPPENGNPGIEARLRNSIDEYRRFRHRIDHRDLVVFDK